MFGWGGNRRDEQELRVTPPADRTEMARALDKIKRMTRQHLSARRRQRERQKQKMAELFTQVVEGGERGVVQNERGGGRRMRRGERERERERTYRMRGRRYIKEGRMNMHIHTYMHTYIHEVTEGRKDESEGRI